MAKELELDRGTLSQRVIVLAACLWSSHTSVEVRPVTWAPYAAPATIPGQSFFGETLALMNIESFAIRALVWAIRFLLVLWEIHFDRRQPAE